MASFVSFFFWAGSVICVLEFCELGTYKARYFAKIWVFLGLVILVA